MPIECACSCAISAYTALVLYILGAYLAHLLTIMMKAALDNEVPMSTHVIAVLLWPIAAVLVFINETGIRAKGG